MSRIFQKQISPSQTLVPVFVEFRHGPKFPVHPFSMAIFLELFFVNHSFLLLSLLTPEPLFPSFVKVLVLEQLSCFTTLPFSPHPNFPQIS